MSCTLLEAANLPRQEILDGCSFLRMLTSTTNVHKSFAFGLQTTRGIFSGSKYYGIRSARNHRYRYIRNLTPEMTFRNLASANRIFQSWREMASAGDPDARRLVHDYQHRPAEELYDCENDPWNRVNLITEAELTAAREELRGQLDAWMKVSPPK